MRFLRLNLKGFGLQLFLIFLLLLLPTLYLLYRSWEHLSTEASFGQKERALLVLQLLNQRIYEDLAIEEKRSYSEYRFIRAVPMIGGEGVTLSDLSRFPVQSHYAGLVGHFQLDPDGSVRTPLIPDGLLEKIPVEHRAQRERVRESMRTILDEMQFQSSLVRRRVVAYPSRYTLSGDSLKPMEGSESGPFQKRFEQPSAKEAVVFDVESELSVTQAASAAQKSGQVRPQDGVRLDVEIEPFQAKLGEHHVIFYRNVWRGEQRFLQGFVVSLAEYLGNLLYKQVQFSPEEKTLCTEFRTANTPLVSFGNCESAKKQELLFDLPLQYPLQDLELAVYRIPQGAPPGSGLILLLGVTMVLVLSGGLYGVFKIVSAQIRISTKRQDFISAVSHELKTPLTAIRMYAELLQNQWVVKEEKRKHYYDMIAGETDRLTRLIQNVLNLSNLERSRWPIHLQLTYPKRFLEEFAQKYAPTVERAGFRFELQLEENEREIFMDRDAMTQMLMNLMENSLKFARHSEPKKIQIAMRSYRDGICISLRDFGPGISAAERERVFQEFYRVENEMTRRTSGAGIGLSLVKKFSQMLNIRIELLAAQPGLLVEMYLPARESF